MSYIDIGPQPELYWLLVMMATGAFIAIQLLDLSETGLYMLGDPRQYVHVKMEKYAIPHSFMIICRLALHVLVLIAYGLFYTGANFREGWLLAMFVMLCTRNVLDLFYQLYFIAYFQYSPKYNIDLTSNEVTATDKVEYDGNKKDKDTLHPTTERVKLYQRVMYVFNYLFLFAFLIMCTAYACIHMFDESDYAVAPTGLETPQICLVVSCCLLVVGMLIHISIQAGPISGDSVLKTKMKAFFKADSGNYLEEINANKITASRTSAIEIKATAEARGGLIENKSLMHEIIKGLGVDTETECVRRFGDNYYKMSNEKAAIADNQFNEKKAGINHTRIGGFLHPLVGELTMFPHLDYDSSSNHRVGNVPLFGVYNTELIGYHVVFFRIMGFGIGNDTVIDTPETLPFYLTTFMIAFYLIFWNNVPAVAIIAGVTLMSSFYLSMLGQKQQYLSQFFYWTYFGWGVMIFVPTIVGNANSYPMKSEVLSSSLIIQSVNDNTTYNEVPEYMISASINLAACILFFSLNVIRAIKTCCPVCMCRCCGKAKVMPEQGASDSKANSEAAPIKPTVLRRRIPLKD